MLFLAETNENGSDRCRNTTESRNEASPDYPDLCWVELIIVNDKDGVLKGDGKSENKYHH